ncbi:hypothetical protein V8C43DRAFT_268121 [Trichoderma afarasin]
MILARMNPHSWRVATGRAGFLLMVVGAYSLARCMNFCRIVHSAKERERERGRGVGPTRVCRLYFPADAFLCREEET